MAINQIQIPTPRQNESTLDKIAQGLNIINGTLGIALTIPKYLQEKQLATQQTDIEKAKVGSQFTPIDESKIIPSGQQKTSPDQISIDQTVQFPSLFGSKKFIPKQDYGEATKQLEYKTKVEDLSKPSPDEVNQLINIMPDVLKKTYSPDVLSGMNKGELDKVKNLLITSNIDQTKKTQLQQQGEIFRIKHETLDYHGGAVPDGYMKKDYSWMDPNDPSLKERLVPNKVANTLENSEFKFKKYDDQQYKEAVQQAEGLLSRGGKNIQQAVWRVQLANDASRIINNWKNGNIVPDEPQAFELARTIDSLISSGGQGSIEMVKHLVPGYTPQASVASIARRISNDPKAFLSNPYIEQFAHSIEGQKQFWGSQVQGWKDISDVQYEDLWNRRPEMKNRFDRQMQQFNQNILGIKDEPVNTITHSDHAKVDNFFNKKP